MPQKKRVDVRVSINLPHSTYQELMAEAEHDHRPLANYILHILELRKASSHHAPAQQEPRTP